MSASTTNPSPTNPSPTTRITLPHDHGSNTAELLNHFPDGETIQAVSAAMKQLGDPSRLRIFWLLCHAEECVTNIAAAVDMSSPAVSHHLKLLKAAGLLTTRREGKEMYYSASEDDLTQSLHHIIEEVGRIACPR